MRKISSKYEEEKKRKKNTLIIGIILIFVMLASVFGIIVNSFGSKNTKSKIEYNGYEFENQNGLWITSKANFIWGFVYSPYEVENISTNSMIKSFALYQNSPLYVLSDDKDSEVEIYRNFAQVAERMQTACLNDEKCEGNFPVKTCSDNFIIIKESETQEIKQQENCVYIQGKKEDLVKLTDAFLYKSIGVR